MIIIAVHSLCVLLFIWCSHKVVVMYSEKNEWCLMEQVRVETRLHVSAAVPHLSHDEDHHERLYHLSKNTRRSSSEKTKQSWERETIYL